MNYGLLFEFVLVSLLQVTLESLFGE